MSERILLTWADNLRNKASVNAGTDNKKSKLQSQAANFLVKVDFKIHGPTYSAQRRYDKIKETENKPLPDLFPKN